jgi:hypothetical protein
LDKRSAKGDEVAGYMRREYALKRAVSSGINEATVEG